MLPKVFFFYLLLLLLLRDPFLLFRFSFPKRENGQKKGLQKDCKDLCVYIPEKGTKKSCEKKPVDDKILVSKAFKFQNRSCKEREEYNDGDALFQGGLFRWILGTLVLSMG